MPMFASRTSRRARGPVSARSLNAVATLGVTAGQRIEVVARGSRPRSSSTRCVRSRPAVRRGRDGGRPVPLKQVGVEQLPDGAIPGVAASPGTAVGPARRLRVPDLPIPKDGRSGTGERGLLERALVSVREDVSRQRDDAEYLTGPRAGHDLRRPPVVPSRSMPCSPRPRPGSSPGEARPRRGQPRSTSSPQCGNGWRTPTYANAPPTSAASVGRFWRGSWVSRSRTRSWTRQGAFVVADLQPADTVGLDPTSVGDRRRARRPTSHAAIYARALGDPRCRRSRRTTAHRRR